MSTAPADAARGAKTRIEYDDTPERQFMIASIFRGIIGMLVGVLIATQMGVWQANFNTAWLTFGRLRPLHSPAAANMHFWLGTVGKWAVSAKQSLNKKTAVRLSVTP